jgi:hypothetical protein
MRGQATYQDVLNAPKNMTAELVDGELFLTPRPPIRAKRLSSALAMCIGGAYDRGHGAPGNWWILRLVEVHLAIDTRFVDVAGWRRERMPVLPTDFYPTVSPDWICEEPPPSSYRGEVPWAWYVEPVQRSVEIRKLIGGELSLIAKYEGNAKFRAEPFMEVEIDLGSIWGER